MSDNKYQLNIDEINKIYAKIEENSKDANYMLLTESTIKFIEMILKSEDKDILSDLRFDNRS